MMTKLPAAQPPSTELALLIERAISSVREDMRDNPYIKEALRVLPVQGYRSAIGAFWNAVVDDLRNKIIFRSLELFNKEVKAERQIKTYEDFQDYVNDDQLIDGAYKIGVIGWEASKILRHAKETRHIFSGHPKSSDPSLIKVFSVMDDCIKYVLNAEYPSKIIDISDYVEGLKSQNFDRNDVAIENALGDLPEAYKSELINRLFTIYVHPGSTSVLTSNIEFISPLLWKVLPKEIKIQIVRRVDQEIPKGDGAITEKAFTFVHLVGGHIYLSHTARKYKIAPLVAELRANMDTWSKENKCVSELHQYAAVVVEECIDDYVWALTHTYVGHIGASARFSRTDFYADVAANYIPAMFQQFNDRMANAFIKTLRESDTLKHRLQNPSKMRRLRSLGNIVNEKVSEAFEGRDVLEALVDESKEDEFFRIVKR